MHFGLWRDFYNFIMFLLDRLHCFDKLCTCECSTVSILQLIILGIDTIQYFYMAIQWGKQNQRNLAADSSFPGTHRSKRYFFNFLLISQIVSINTLLVSLEGSFQWQWVGGAHFPKL